MGGSTEENQADIGRDDSSVVGNSSTEKGDPIDGVSPAKDLEVNTMTVENVTHTRQGQTPVTDSLMGESTKGNQADIGRGHSSIDRNTSTDESVPIDGVSPAKDLELITTTVENITNTR